MAMKLVWVTTLEYWLVWITSISLIYGSHHLAPYCAAIPVFPEPGLLFDSVNLSDP